jgi:hypothetical protein
LERGKATGEGRALFDRAAYALILEYLCASGFFERGQLQGGCLVVGAGSRIAVFHDCILKQTYETFKPLFSLGCSDVSKLTLCATSGRKIGGRSFCLVFDDLRNLESPANARPCF